MLCCKICSSEEHFRDSVYNWGLTKIQTNLIEIIPPHAIIGGVSDII